MHKVHLFHYDVVLKPSSDVEHDPVSITLAFTPEDAATFEPNSPAAKRQAFDRAVALEHRTHHTTANFMSGGIKLTRMRVIESERAAMSNAQRLARGRAMARHSTKRRDANGRRR